MHLGMTDCEGADYRLVLFYTRKPGKGSHLVARGAHPCRALSDRMGILKLMKPPGRLDLSSVPTHEPSQIPHPVAQTATRVGHPRLPHLSRGLAAC
jgi:hypothetical protein